MPNAENLRPKPFTTENQPANRGRKKGIPNRSTLLKKWTGVKLKIINPITKNKQRGTVEDEVILALIRKARGGDVTAIKEVQDSLYGKITDKTELSGLVEVATRVITPEE